MNSFAFVLYFVIFINLVLSIKYDVVVENAKDLIEHEWIDKNIYVAIYVYCNDDPILYIRHTKPIHNNNNNAPEWDEAFTFEFEQEACTKNAEFIFKLFEHENKDIVLAKTKPIYASEITQCDEWCTKDICIYSDNNYQQQSGMLFVSISKHCPPPTAIYGVSMILPDEYHKYGTNYEHGVKGEITFKSEGDKTRIKGIITGLTPLQKHGFHVHELGDLSGGCLTTLGHYNPFNNNHGGPDDTIRHVGDLGNIYADESGVAVIDIIDSIIQLTSDTSVIGRAVVIHECIDDLGKGGDSESLITGNARGRLGCGVIGIGNENHEDIDMKYGVQRAVSILSPNDLTDHKGVRGRVIFEYEGETKTRIRGEISGLNPGQLHGFHVHQLGNFTNGCISAAGHYNPFNNNHGAPDDGIRHIGDLGNVYADNYGVAKIDIIQSNIKLNGATSIIGRSVVVHELEDDLGRGGDDESLITGNAAGRLACGVIGIIDDNQE